MSNWPINVIPNPIDPNVWAPCNQVEVRSLLGLSLNSPLVLFGALGGTVDPRKGADLLFEALQTLRVQVAGTPLEKFQLTGVLAEPFDPLSLASAIKWVLEDRQRRQKLGFAARQRAQQLWDPFRISGLYTDVLHRVNMSAR